tara:strand:- start:2136 stop:2969 length:834 start_codon:yes stop_codon:yes gene_type:complete
MTNKELQEVNERIQIARLDPNHTGIKQLVYTGDGINFELVKAYNLGYGIASQNGELHLYEHLRDKIKVLVDAGARDDTYFLTEPGTDYHLFEPDPKNYARLEENIKHIGSDINVYANNCGLGNSNEPLGFFNSEHGNGTFISQNIEGPVLQPDLFIETTRLEDYAKSKNISHIDFLKIDVEGFELEVLKGTGELLHNTSYVQFEYGNTFKDSNITLKGVCDYLIKYGLTNFYTVCTNGLIDQRSTHDHYMMCNVLAARSATDIKDIINHPTLYNVYV